MSVNAGVHTCMHGEWVCLVDPLFWGGGSIFMQPDLFRLTLVPSGYWWGQTGGNTTSMKLGAEAIGQPLRPPQISKGTRLLRKWLMTMNRKSLQRRRVTFERGGSGSGNDVRNERGMGRNGEETSKRIFKRMKLKGPQGSPAQPSCFKAEEALLPRTVMICSRSHSKGEEGTRTHNKLLGISI